MKVRKLKKQETRALMPSRGNGFPGVFAVGATAVVIAAMMMLATTPGLAETVEGWGEAEPIEVNDAFAYLPEVAVDRDGNAIAVWHQFDGIQGSIWSNRYVVGAGWGNAELIGADYGDANYPQVAIDGEGNAIAVWEQWDGTQCSIYSNRYVVGVGWGDAQLIEADDRFAGSPQLAMTEDGNAVAVWRQMDDTGMSIWSKQYVVGVGWGGAQPIESDSGGVYSSQVAIDGEGNAIAIWGQWDGKNNIWSNRYVVGVGWGDAQLIETENGNAYNSQVAIDGEGNAIAVWDQFDGTGLNMNIWSNRYVVGVGWGVAQLIEKIDDGNAGSPQVAMGVDGNAIAVWHQDDGARASIWSNRYVVGVGWGEAQLIEADDWSASYPQVAMDEEGNAITVWQQDNPVASIYSNRYVVGVGWGEAQPIETEDRYAYYPQVAMNEDGNAIAVWPQYDDAQPSIWSNRFINLVDQYQHRHCNVNSEADALTL